MYRYRCNDSFQGHLDNGIFQSAIIKYIRRQIVICEGFNTQVRSLPPFVPDCFPGTDIDEKLTDVINCIKAEWCREWLVQNNPSVLITTTQNGINSGLEVEVSGESSVNNDTESVTDIDSEYVNMGVEDNIEYSAYSYNGNNWVNTHRMIMRPGITMRQEFRPWVAWLPRAYPGSCPICL